MASLHEDLLHMNQFLETQRGSLPTASWDAVTQAQSTALATWILAARISVDQAASLSAAVAAGPWDPASKQRLVEALSTTLQQGSGTNKGRRPNQTLVAGFRSFLTDRAALISEDHSFHKIRTVVERCVSITFHLPSERAIGHVVAEAIELGANATTPQDRYALLNSFKTQLRARLKQVPAAPQHLADFPGNPRNLPEQIFQQAYPDPADQPAKVEGIAPVPPQAMPLRKTSRLVHSDTNSLAGPQDSTQSPIAMMTQFLSAFQTMMHGSALSSTVPGLQVFADQRKNKALMNGISTGPSEWLHHSTNFGHSAASI